MERYRHRFTEGLNRRYEEVRLDTPEARHQALSAVGNHTNTRCVPGAKGSAAAKKYGNLVHQIMAANYPNWVRHLPAGRHPPKVSCGLVMSLRASET